MNWTWLIILLSALAVHGVLSGVALLQMKRFWGLNKRNRRVSFFFAFTVLTIDVLILAAFVQMQN